MIMNYYKEIIISDSKLGDDKVKLARIQYRGKGKYIDEILLNGSNINEL